MKSLEVKHRRTTKTFEKQAYLCYCAFECFMLYLVSKFRGRDYRIYVHVKDQNVRVRLPKDNLRVLENDKNVFHQAIKTFPNDAQVDAQQINRLTVKKGVSLNLDMTYQTPNEGNLTKTIENRTNHHSMDAPSSSVVIWFLQFYTSLGQGKG